MAVRSYYWNARKVSTFKYFLGKIQNSQEITFRYGNAGDIFNADLIRYIYKDEPVNKDWQGHRLFLIGSILKKIQAGDIINGIGWKGDDVSSLEHHIRNAKVFGVRGPLTKSIFEKYGANLSDLKFELDPGLLIREVYNIDLTNSTEDQVIFIPHYRDMKVYKNSYPKGVKVINIDNKPQTIADQILKSKVVYASSLHGIIFAHSLGKPAVFVAPQSKEPIFKYRDYYLSIGYDMPEPLQNIYSLNFTTDIALLPTRNFSVKDFYFPDYEYLKECKVVEP